MGTPSSWAAPLLWLILAVHVATSAGCDLACTSESSGGRWRVLGPNGALLKASPCDAEAQRTLPTAAVFLSDGRRQLCNGVCYLQASLDGAAYWLADSSCLDEGPANEPEDCKACDSSATPGLLQVAGAAAQVFYSLQPPEPFPYPVPPGAVLETTGVRAASQGRCYVQVQFWDMKLWLPDHACTQGASSHAQPEGCPACVSTGPGYQTALRAGQYGRIPALDADNPTPGDCGFDAATTGAVAAGERLASDGARAICGGQCFLSVDVAGEKRWLQDGSCAGEQPAVQPVAVVSKDPTPACIKLQFYDFDGRIGQGEFPCLQEQLAAQVEVLNEAYKPAGIKFSFGGLEDGDRNHPEFISTAEAFGYCMDSKYTSKDAISVHLVNHGTGEDEKWMGMSPCITDSFPFEGPCDRPCIALRTSVLPPWAPAPGPDGQARCVPVQEDSGSYSDTFKGYMLVHETGHVLGLLHTFDENGAGDGVADTPHEAEPVRFALPGQCGALEYLDGVWAPRAPEDNRPPDVCCRDDYGVSPGEHLDPGTNAIHNFMTYSPEYCQWAGFTQGQVDRVREKIAKYYAHTWARCDA